jgi:UDP-N-acetylmuramate--alanine ligase
MNRYNHYHLIGIGGIGMSGIAQLLLRRGFKVSGSDLKESRITDDLKKIGGHIFIGHDPCHIQGANLVIYSSAIKENNPEIQEAKKRNIPFIRRAQALAELMQEETVITVSGSHGKTTTTSLVSYLLLKARLKPSLAIGGILRNIDNNAYLGEGKIFVAEADESDGTFLYYRPKYSIITNIDYEHLDYYRSFKNEVNAFRSFIQRTRGDGCVFGCADDKNLRDILKNYKNKYVLFGLNANAYIYPKNIQTNGLSSYFDCFYRDKFLGNFSLSLGGLHNVSNALSVIALGLELGIDTALIKQALSTYQGVERRIEIKFENKDYLVIDDYAHHPTEIKATLYAVRNLRKKVIAIFQPHRYTRTKLLLDEFGKSFSLADQVIITDIYPAAEEPIPGITGSSLYERIRKDGQAKQVEFLPKEQIPNYILEIIRPGDLVITLGAGDIVKTCDELVKRLKNKN